ncbi:uncharacterized protein B4U79_01358 [Dinothrombium tinctorium]|uniref:Calcineurin-like phosphoesterase domain-containing protein n=1 Tax=Dinothrombium tinctorium TaxID=1965070 RepID=A0A3S3PBZ8_9ACAR|nr:uncharacterized protein B4U79_01358 [Dinothrombium tinctorium]
MVMILEHLLLWFRQAFVKESETLIKHPFGIPLPPELHKTLDDSFVNKFEEVLIIGDIHGCFDEMKECIDAVHLYNRNILKLFVGDLVNKGPKSKAVIEYLMGEGKDSCLSVRGNHDEVVIREYMKYEIDPSSLAEKNEWMKELTKQQINYLISLPYTITIPSLNLIVVHAGLVPGLDLSLMKLTDFVTMRNIIFTDYFEEEGIKATKSHKEGEPWAKHWRGPSHVYFGHDAKRKLQLYPFATGLDTGCVYGNTLTAVFAKGPRKGSFINIKAKKVYQDAKAKENN